MKPSKIALRVGNILAICVKSFGTPCLIIHLPNQTYSFSWAKTCCFLSFVSNTLGKKTVILALFHSSNKKKYSLPLYNGRMITAISSSLHGNKISYIWHKPTFL